MIKVSKPKVIPEILRTRGEVENVKNCADYIADPGSYITSASKFKFNNKIYGDPTVKDILKIAQHNKCCFCEKKQGDEDGAVEHFRPKGGYKIQKKLLKPGYYWLGYEWSNLFFVCTRCNSAANKGNKFPLLDESKRVKSHLGNIKDEIPLLLDPGGRKDPRKHIIFEGQFAKGKTEYGNRTIEICGIGRDALNNMRKELIAEIDFCVVVILGISSAPTSNPKGKRVVDDAKKFIRNSINAEAKFSATAVDYLSTLNISFD